MKKKLILGMMVAVSVMQVASPALAENSQRPGQYPASPVPPPPPPGQYLQEGSLEIQSVSRRAGGEWYRITLRRAISLDSIEIAPLAMRLKIHEASVITENRQRIQIREFRNTEVFGVGSRAVSERLHGDRVMAIDIRAESYGGSADIRVMALSSEARPQMVLGEIAPDRPTYPDQGTNQCARRGDVIPVLKRLDADLKVWSDRKDSSSYGSTEYNMAVRELKAIAQRMVEVAQSRAARETTLEKMEALGALFFSKMYGESYGSTEFNAYSEVGKAMFSAMEGGLDLTVSCDLKTTEQILALADLNVKKMYDQSYGSVPYNAYNSLAKKLYVLAPSFYEKELRYKDKTFRHMNTDLEAYMHKAYDYSYGSLAYDSYVSMVNKVSALSQANLRQVAGHLGANVRFELMRHFDFQKNKFSYGSLVYNHYATMKEIVSK